MAAETLDVNDCWSNRCHESSHIRSRGAAAESTPRRDHTRSEHLSSMLIHFVWSLHHPIRASGVLRWISPHLGSRCTRRASRVRRQLGGGTPHRRYKRALECPRLQQPNPTLPFNSRILYQTYQVCETCSSAPSPTHLLSQDAIHLPRQPRPRSHPHRRRHRQSLHAPRPCGVPLDVRKRCGMCRLPLRCQVHLHHRGHSGLRRSTFSQISGKRRPTDRFCW